VKRSSPEFLFQWCTQNIDCEKTIYRLLLKYYIVLNKSLLLLLCGGIAKGVPRFATISDLLLVPIWVLITHYSSPRIRWQLPADIYLARDGREFFRQTISFVPVGLLTYRKILRHGTDGLTSAPKEVVIHSFSPLKSIVRGRVWARKSWVEWQAC
jgi:hypothetical protein